MINDICFFCHRPLKGRFKLTPVHFYVGIHKPEDVCVSVQVHTKCLPLEVKDQIPDARVKAKRFFDEWWTIHQYDERN